MITVTDDGLARYAEAARLLRFYGPPSCSNVRSSSQNKAGVSAVRRAVVSVRDGRLEQRCFLNRFDGQLYAHRLSLASMLSHSCLRSLPPRS